MNTADDIGERLARLERILATRPPVSGGEGSESGEALLNAIATDRIVHVTRELQRRADRDLDAADVLVMRILLNDYTSAVAQLRALVEATNERLERARETIRAGTDLIQHAIEGNARD